MKPFETPLDCVAGIRLTELERNLIVARIEYLLTQHVHTAVMAAIEQTHQAAMNALIAPIKAAEIDKAS